ncbi:hypothetical protein ABZ760_29750 [Streptomyces sp. NPDC006658]|uniref:hypothetical protein n=1 Tax=Streptomyces sp. NPDC006658 TaxID=3156900 RepID=UPI0033F43C7D
MSEVRCNRPTAARLRAPTARDAGVPLPIGATEQHGPRPATRADGFLAAEAYARGGGAGLGADPRWR